MAVCYSGKVTHKMDKLFNKAIRILPDMLKKNFLTAKVAKFFGAKLAKNLLSILSLTFFAVNGFIF
jgi:hypothetical protein